MSELIEYIKDKIYLKRLDMRVKKIHRLIDEHGVFGPEDSYEDRMQFLKDIDVE